MLGILSENLYMQFFIKVSIGQWFIIHIMAIKGLLVEYYRVLYATWCKRNSLKTHITRISLHLT